MSSQFIPLENGEVLSVEDAAQILIGHRTFRAGEFSEAIRAQLEYGLGGWTQEKDGWFSEVGIPCEVLRFGANTWERGTVRIRLEFSPDSTNGASAKRLQEERPQNKPAETSQNNFDVGQSAPSFDELELVPTMSFSNEVNQSTVVSEDLDLTPEVIIPDDLDLDESPVLTEEELVFAELSGDDDSEENQEADSLLDDVWQDMNQASWQGSQY